MLVDSSLQVPILHASTMAALTLGLASAKAGADAPRCRPLRETLLAVMAAFVSEKIGRAHV